MKKINGENVITFLVIILALLLSVRYFYKAIGGGYFVLAVLFDDGLFNLLVAIFTTICCALFCMKILKKKRGLEKVLKILGACMMTLITISIICSGLFTSYKEISSSEKLDDFIKIQDIMKTSKTDNIEGHVKKYSPFIGTCIFKTEQISKQGRDYLISERITGPTWIIESTNDEMIRYLKNEYDASDIATSDSITVGTIKKDGSDFKFMCYIGDREFVGIFVKSHDDSLFNQVVTYYSKKSD